MNEMKLPKYISHVLMYPKTIYKCNWTTEEVYFMKSFHLCSKKIDFVGISSSFIF